jgi:hypothetical protein
MDGVLGVEDNILGLVPYKELVGFLFFYFSFSFRFSEFCRSIDFEFLNSVLTKNLAIASSF